jgi:GNAT superfamily N-acetyltransferase
MAPSETLASSDPRAGAAEGVIERLAARDVEAGLALSDAAGWNQTADDWALFIGRGETLGIRAASRRLVATAAALPYGPTQGWISMVLVADDWRHRGLASRLVDACVASLRARGLVPVLDATPAGAEVYRRIGFVGGFAFERWERTSVVDDATAPRDSSDAGDKAPTPVGREALATLVGLDHGASALDRGTLLDGFLSRSGTRAWLSRDGRGFAIARAGRRATQIGPVVAADPSSAQALLDAAIAASEGPAGARTFLDLPVAHAAIAASLERRGWTRQRAFVRMALGAVAPPALDPRSIVVAGPEFG